MPDTHIIDAHTVLLTSDTSLPIDTNWFTPDYWKKQGALAGTAQGRGAVWFILSNYGHFVMRRYRRGGLVAKFNKSYFLFSGLKNTRPWLELSLLETMQDMGLPIPRPIGGIYSVKKGYYKATLITETINCARDLFDILKDGFSSEIDWHDIGRVIRQFHDHGIHHSDLNCHNIMIDDNKKVWLIDFDKCDQRPINEEWPQKNLDRLKRSINKESKKHTHFTVSDEQWHDLLEGYRG
ncbi:3-deoxy-D-manno-octulosonic acid kinase [Marinomonas spartinae]|uniref:3-deoxy-D-manno-octulosonic acid kinase n=1 Tax=Marinomonas spartinae TaxID=1792290 RepID=A0A1A8TEX2_9GAMM|nr:3-deoxy-D-manno-octulosonic acid kinase [Marinomonas spartinae]SBS30659.1 3-deoxy-D-manno-octulosonic acid kinase [Marinomonas spartinae]